MAPPHRSLFKQYTMCGGTMCGGGDALLSLKSEHKKRFAVSLRRVPFRILYFYERYFSSGSKTVWSGGSSRDLRPCQRFQVEKLVSERSKQLISANLRSRRVPISAGGYVVPPDQSVFSRTSMIATPDVVICLLEPLKLTASALQHTHISENPAHLAAIY